MRRRLKKSELLRILFLEVPVFFVGVELLLTYLQTIEFTLTEWRSDLYWIAIIGFGFMYGLRVGGVVSFVAALILIPWYDIYDLYGMDLAGSLAHPVFMLFGGLLAGILSSRQMTLLQDFRQTSRDVTEKLEEVEEDRQRLIAANLALEKKAVSREDTVLTLYSAAQKLSSLEIDKIYEGVPELLIRYLNARSCSIYLHEHHRLQLITQENWAFPDQYPHIYDRDHQLYRMLQQKRRVLYPTDLEGVDEAMLVAPLLNTEKRLLGIMKIEDMGFMDLHPNSVQLFQILGEWVIQAIENAQAYGTSAETQIQDELTGAYTFAYFQSRLGREIRLTRRYNLDLSVVFVQIVNFKAMDSKTQKAVLGIVSRVLEFQIRSDDLIARFKNHGEYQFGIIFPFTGSVGAQQAVERCSADISGYQFKPFEDEKETLDLYWEAVETKDQSLYTHPIVVEYVSQENDGRIDRWVDRLLS